MRRIHFTTGLGGRVAFADHAFAFDFHFQVSHIVRSHGVGGVEIAGPHQPAQDHSLVFIGMVIWRSASTTRVPLGSTAATRPSVVVRAVWEVACAFPARACAEVGENRLATPEVEMCPGRAVIPELAERFRLVETLPVLVAERFCEAADGDQIAHARGLVVGHHVG